MAGPASSNLAVRLLTAAVGVPAILALLYEAPDWGFYALAFAAALVGCAELFAMTHPGDRIGQGVGVALCAAASLALYFGGDDARIVRTVLIGVPLLGPLLTLARLGSLSTAALRALALSAGPFLVAVPMTLLAIMKRDLGAQGPGTVILALMLAWLGDTGGYFAGRFLGRHKLYEAVSPKKTVEGALGGLAGSVVGALFASFISLRSLPVGHAILLGLVAGAAGQAGDLAESLLKRSTGVKDSGSIVPGHGGILDRVDALIFTSAVVYLDRLWLH